MLALALAVPLAAAYLVLEPPSGDLAAATYRGDLFARAGFTLWDNNWYGGHYLPGYSLLAPALGALIGERLLLALCAIAAAGLFGLLAQQAFGSAAARVAGGSFALGVCVGLLSGRVAYGLGITIGLLALLALTRGWTSAALGLAALTSLASPVAGAFLALAGLADALGAPPPSARRILTRQTSGVASTSTRLRPRSGRAHTDPGAGACLSRRWLGAVRAVAVLACPRWSDASRTDTHANAPRPRAGNPADANARRLAVRAGPCGGARAAHPGRRECPRVSGRCSGARWRLGYCGSSGASP